MLSSTFTTQNSWGIRSNFPKGRQEWELEARKLPGLIFLKTFSLSRIIMFSLSTGPCPPAYKHILPSNLIHSSTLHLSLLMDPWLCSPCGLLFFPVLNPLRLSVHAHHFSLAVMATHGHHIAQSTERLHSASHSTYTNILFLIISSFVTCPQKSSLTPSHYFTSHSASVSFAGFF